MTLVYSSAQAAPMPIAVAAVTEGGTTIARPNGVVAELKVYVGGAWTSMRTASYAPWGNPNGLVQAETRQVALSWDAHTAPSGVYPFQLLVTNQYTGQQSLSQVASGQFLVNNRATSPFYGIGWWPAGIEQLAPATGQGLAGPQALYGPDGSVKLFAPISAPAGQDRWLGAPEAFPDTLVYDSTAQRYSRTLRHGIKIVYDAAGRHIQTINRTGDTTFITYNGNGGISSIRVPPSGQSGTTYTFTYLPTTGVLQAITDPAGRVLTATSNGGQLTALQDPDLVSTTFTYDAYSRMTSRTSRRGAATGYVFTNNRLTRIAIPLKVATGDSAVTTIRPWLAVGLDGAAPDVPDSGYTRVDGPRNNVADIAEFWVDQWGAPVKSVGPNGDMTQLSRGASALPALVTRIVLPDGAVDSLFYNARGNLADERDSTSQLTNGLPTAVTHWTYNSANAPDSPDGITDPAGITTHYTYNTFGLTQTATAANGHVTQFGYCQAGSCNGSSALDGLLRSVAELKVVVWDSATQTRILKDSLHTGFALNTLGNVVADTSPMGRVSSYTLDSYQRVANAYDPAGHRTEYVYDILNRTTRVRQHTEQAGYNSTLYPADLTVAGPLETQFNFTNDVLTSVVDPRGVTRGYGYDDGGRKVTETDEFNHSTSYWYNPAGALDSTRLRSGQVIRYFYDAGGRLVQTAWPSRDGLQADTVVSQYDIMGRLTYATTKARGYSLARTYYANGLPRTDTATDPSNLTQVRQVFTYDNAGRRLGWRVGAPSDGTTSDSVTYAYNSAGQLANLITRWRNTGLNPAPDTVRFWWDSLGRRDSVTYSQSVAVRFAYDPDGNQRVICAVDPQGSVSSNNPFKFVAVIDWLDNDGMARHVNTTGAAALGCTTNNAPSLLSTNGYNNRHQLIQQAQGGTTFTFRYDASGNRTQVAAAGGQNYTYVDTLVPGSNRLLAHVNASNGWQEIDYDLNGGRVEETPCTTPGGCSKQNLTYRVYMYDGMNRIGGFSQNACSYDASGGTCLTIDSLAATARCYYDPLGRLRFGCENGGPPLAYDGDNVARTGSDGVTTGWTFVHGPGLDDPVVGYHAATNTKAYFITDGNGRQYAVGTPGGSPLPNQNGVNDDKYAGGTSNSLSFTAERTPTTAAPGLSFFRNRFYDQGSGRWTQEDPLGVLGGVNLYQFNGNNPTGYTDPFGLCKESERGNATQSQQCASDISGMWCPSGARGSYPDCTSIAQGTPVAGSCPNVSQQEWDLGQRAIERTRSSGLEEGSVISNSGAATDMTGPGWVQTDTTIGPRERWPSDAATSVHSHPTGRGISPGDIDMTNDTGIRSVSAGVGTNRYGSYSRGDIATTCDLPTRP